MINLALAALKFVVGIVGASQALVADAVHSLSDSVTDIAVLVGAPYWAAAADDDHPYGHGRIETIFTFVIGTVLGVVGLGLAYNALATIQTAHRSAPGWSAFVAACVSMASKEVLYRWTIRVGRRVKSSALMANAWHHRSDGLSSLPVAIAVLGTRLKPDWGFLDHVGALVVSVFILQASWKILWPALEQLADTGATAREREQLLALAASIEGVKEVHALRTRRIGPGMQVDLHVLVQPQLSVQRAHEIADAVHHRLVNEGRDVVDVLVHIEPHKEQGTDIS